MSLLESWLYEATKVLLLPVIVALVALGVFALVMLGGFLRELLDRRASEVDLGGQAEAQRGSLVAARGMPGLLGVFERTARDADGAVDQLDEAATWCELEAARRVSRLNLVARAGPTLGLMATLIPMGPALLALADNDVAGLARSLVVAFTATVCGLLVGLLCATMASVRRHWYAADLAAVDALVARLEGGRA